MVFEIRPMSPDEANEVSHLVNRVYDHHGSLDSLVEGVAAFRAHSDPEAIVRRSAAGHQAIVALKDGRPVGVIEIRNHRHLTLFFVAPDCQGLEVGRKLQDGLRFIPMTLEVPGVLA